MSAWARLALYPAPLPQAPRPTGIEMHNVAVGYNQRLGDVALEGKLGMLLEVLELAVHRNDHLRPQQLVHLPELVLRRVSRHVRWKQLAVLDNIDAFGRGGGKDNWGAGEQRPCEGHAKIRGN